MSLKSKRSKPDKKSRERLSSFFVASSKASELFHAAEKALHQISALVHFLVIATRVTGIRTGRYYSIPDFPIPQITPQKLTYYKVMLGETTELLDTERIEQAVALLNEVEIINTPTKRNSVEWEEDGDLHQVISFYKDVDDEKPEYSLCFLVNSLYIQTNEIKSDVYPTPNWDNEGAYDETKIDDRFRRLIDSWSEPSFPPLP